MSVVCEKSVGRVYKSNIVAIVISFAFVPSFFGIYGSNIRAPLLPPTHLKHTGVKLLLKEKLEFTLGRFHMDKAIRPLLR